MWLRDTLPHDITTEVDGKPYARVMIFGYESSLPQSKSMQNLEDLATSFRSSLLELVSTSTLRPIIFVAHSLGGLIVKQVRPFLELVRYLSHHELDPHIYVQINKGGRSEAHPSRVRNRLFWRPARGDRHQFARPYGRGWAKPVFPRVYRKHKFTGSQQPAARFSRSLRGARQV